MNPPTPFDLVGLGSAGPGPGVAVDPSMVNEPLREISMEELNRNDGATEGTPIYIAVLGTVYDVSNATKLYGPGSPYGVFAGRDATRGLATFNMSEKRVEAAQNNCDYSDLSERHLENVKRWQTLYNLKYPVVGTLKISNCNNKASGNAGQVSKENGKAALKYSYGEPSSSSSAGGSRKIPTNDVSTNRKVEEAVKSGCKESGFCVLV